MKGCGMKDILRWVAFLPAAIIGSIIASVIVLYMNPGLKGGSPVVGTIDAALACFAFWYCFYRISDYVIPDKGKKFAYWMSVILCGAVVLLGIIAMLITPFIDNEGLFNYETAINISRIIGAAIAFYLIFKKAR